MGVTTQSSHCAFSFAMIWWSGHFLLPFVAGSEHAYHPRNLKMPAPLGEGTGNEDQDKPVDPSYPTPADEVYKVGDKVDCTTPWRRLSTRTSACPTWRRPASPRSSARTCTRRTAPPSSTSLRSGSAST